MFTHFQLELPFAIFRASSSNTLYIPKVSQHHLQAGARYQLIGFSIIEAQTTYGAIPEYWTNKNAPYSQFSHIPWSLKPDHLLCIKLLRNQGLAFCQLSHRLSSELSPQLSPALSHELPPELFPELSNELSAELSPEMSLKFAESLGL